jgi:tetratricopeptide (TPR) repeat protein
MEVRRMRAATCVAGLVLVLAGHSTAAAASREMPGSEKAVVVGQWAFERLERAQKALAEEDLDASLAALDEMRKNERLTPYEQALMWQTYGYVHSSREEYELAATDFENCLAAEGLPEDAALNSRYNLAQLYLMLDRYADAIPLLEEWFDKSQNPSPAAYYAMAVAYLQTDNREKALRYAKQAVGKALEPKEPWLALLLSFHLEDQAYAEAAVLLEQLAARFPKKVYWTQLSAVYSALDDSRRALAALEVAYRQNALTEEGDLVRLAQLYFFNGIPYEAARVLERGMGEGVITPDADSWELLANSWLYAQERRRAAGPLERAAALSDKGDLYVRVAQLRLEDEKWSEAAAALQAAFRKGHLQDPGTAHLMFGIATAGAQKWDEAARALEHAQGYEKTEKAATAWLAHLAKEKEIAQASN